jgi:hypothetical protein
MKGRSKHKPTTVKEVIRELRAEQREKRGAAFQAHCDGNYILEDSLTYSACALLFAARFIERHKVTATTLQRALDEQTARKGALEHYR